jgi:predicted ATPase
MMKEFPFVGRDTDMGKLVGLWQDVSTSGKGPRIVTVLGEPGYGKTRLIKEFYRHIWCSVGP